MCHNQMARRRYNAAQAAARAADGSAEMKIEYLLCSRGAVDCSGTQFWPLYQFRSGAETGTDFRSVKPNPGINPEPNPEPKADPEDK